MRADSSHSANSAGDVDRYSSSSLSIFPYTTTNQPRTTLFLRQLPLRRYSKNIGSKKALVFHPSHIVPTEKIDVFLSPRIDDTFVKAFGAVERIPNPEHPGLVKCYRFSQNNNVILPYHAIAPRIFVPVLIIHDLLLPDLSSDER